MPIYEYTCQNCIEVFAVLRPIAEADSETICPRCGNSDARRMVSTFVAFSSEGGQSRASAGQSGCHGCASAGSACATCAVGH